ncbi:MAG: histidinol-phosphatase [Opitutae bacterium]|nr:histidinol-phosphatase [Opitutae bacterium]MBG31247.1 histidinol-phosphatase [Opitutae bacterium]|tara:strand:- start:5020 stop:5784 length:765 start_codon:yes stop_codon:yes gene_type:complete
MNLTEIRSFVQSLVEESGRIILAHYLDPNLEVEYKVDETPVTLADREAESLIRKRIEEEFPEHGIIGEEYGSIREDAEYVWLLDPIDGTKSFISGVPLFGTIICLKRAGEPIFGAIHQPVLQQLMLGDNTQTTLNDKPMVIRKPNGLDQATILTTDERDARKRFGVETWVKLTDQTFFSRTWGDCYGYLLLASGKADVMIDPIVNSWDFHAMIPIIRGAGGKITDHKGRNPLHGNSIVTSHPDLHDLIIKSLGN